MNTKQLEVSNSLGWWPSSISALPSFFAQTAPSLRVLLLDDDPIYRKLVARVCERRKIRITTCKDFGELKNCWNAEKPNFVVVDFDLDDQTTGPEVARLLGDIPVLLVSRKASWLPERREWNENIRGFFHKKYGVAGLVDRVVEIASAEKHMAPFLEL